MSLTAEDVAALIREMNQDATLVTGAILTAGSLDLQEKSHEEALVLLEGTLELLTNQIDKYTVVAEKFRNSSDLREAGSMAVHVTNLRKCHADIAKEVTRIRKALGGTL